MKRILILLVAVAIVVAGCGGGDLKSKIVGVWKFDATTLAGPKLTDAIKKDAVTAMSSATMELKADGTFSGTSMGQSGTGKWTLADHTLTVTTDKTTDPKNEPTFTVNDDGSKIHMTAPGGLMTVDLVKSK